MTAPHVILSGVVGSTAYGLAGPDSDIDRLGVFATPTENLHGLKTPEESIVTTGPDVTLHEAGKWCALALNGNPTAMELVWLDAYETLTPHGAALIQIRQAFLSAPRVRAAYLGYASQQFKKLELRGDGSFSADTRKRTAKHARHLARLLRQGFQLYRTGHLTIRLDDPEWFHDFGEQVASGGIDAARQLLHDTEAGFDYNPTVLPDQPDTAAVEAWLRNVRRDYLEAHQMRRMPSLRPPAADKSWLEVEGSLRMDATLGRWPRP